MKKFKELNGADKSATVILPIIFLVLISAALYGEKHPSFYGEKHVAPITYSVVETNENREFDVSRYNANPYDKPIGLSCDFTKPSQVKCYTMIRDRK